MSKPKKHKGFTLIEILIAIIIIGILAAIILVMVSGKDKARQKSAYAEARAVQAELLQCVINNGWNEFCHSVDPDVCQGNVIAPGVPYATPYATYSVCRDRNDINKQSSAKWPNISRYNYIYGSGACSVLSMGAFNYAIYKTGAATNDKIFCCTQNGCSEIVISGTYGPFANCTSTTDLQKTLCQCKKMAGLDVYGPGTCY